MATILIAFPLTPQPWQTNNPSLIDTPALAWLSSWKGHLTFCQLSMLRLSLPP
jgi:hypothetical protein